MKKTIYVSLFCLLAVFGYSWFASYMVYDNPSWSPDSAKLVYEENSINPDGYDYYDIRLKSLDGKIDRPLSMWCESMNFSPDYKFLIISDNVLMEVNDSKNIIDFIKGYKFAEHSSVRHTAWSPDSKKLAFVICNYADDTSSIGIYDLKTGKWKMIVKDKYAHDNDENDYLLWLENRIVFTSAKKPGQVEPGEYVIRSVSIDGKDGKTLTDVKRNKNQNFSKDKVLTTQGVFRIVDEGEGAGEDEETAGQSIVLRNKEGKDIMIMPANGSNPVWSPAVEIIAFDSLRKDGKNIWLYDVNKGAYTQLTFQGGTEPRWSMDGSKIAFKRGKQSYVIDADGTNIRKMKDSENAGFIKKYDKLYGIKSPNGKLTAYNRPGETKNYESYEWSTLVVKDEFGRETVVGERSANF